MDYFVADWHLGEDRFELMQRPFTTVLDHVETIIAKHNEVVSDNDHVYVLGDAIYQKAGPEWFEAIGRMHGTKTLIRGNHDRVFTDEQFTPYFNQIVSEGEGIELEVGDIPCYLTHYPTLGRPDRFNLVGHIHGIWKFQLNSLNVGVDAHHFYPTPASKIPFYFTAVTKFYDRDAWAAYEDCNQRFVGQRGNQSVYFQKNS